MIVGEDQIQGQVKRSYEAALAQRRDRPADQPPVRGRAADRQARAHRDRDRRAPAVSRRRSRWRWPPSSSARWPDREVVIVGTGETSELAARALRRQRRRAACSWPAAAATGRSASPPATAAPACRFDELPEALLSADIVVAATASPHLLIEVDEIAEVMRERDGRPLLLIDLAVPRDIEAACARRRRASRCATSTTSRRSSRATARSARPRRARAESDRRGGDPGASRAGSARSRCCRRSPRCARSADADRRAVVAENAQHVGDRLAA